MANLISAYDTDSLRDLAYSRPSERISSYIREKFERGISNISERYRDRIASVQKRIADSELYRNTLSSFRRLRNRGRYDGVCQLTDIGALQNATRHMQKYLMSGKKLRQRYRDRMCEGYRGSYVDSQPNAIGHTDRHYRLIFDGVSIHNAKLNCGEAFTYGLSKEDRNELTVQERGDIRISIAACEQALVKGLDDPSSVTNAIL